MSNKAIISSILIIFTLIACKSEGPTMYMNLDYPWKQSDPTILDGKSFLEFTETPSQEMTYSLDEYKALEQMMLYPQWDQDVTKNHRYRFEHGISRPIRAGSGINLNGLDGPSHGAWGSYIRQEDIANIKHAGFQILRLPIRFQAHLSSRDPIVVKEEFLDQLDMILQEALAQGFIVILDFHHFLNYDILEEFSSDQEEADMVSQFLQIWEILADRYRSYPQELYFELLNEPHLPFSQEIWNRVQREALKLVRDSGGNNRTRTIILTSGYWSHVGALEYLEIPSYQEDPNLIITFHYYEPFVFTHQAINWGPMQSFAHRWKGNVWRATEEQRRLVYQDLKIVHEWALENQRPIFMGEFGTNHHSDRESRQSYIRFLRNTAEEFGFSWAVWSYNAQDSFGIYDRLRGWNLDLLDCLIPIIEE